MDLREIQSSTTNWWLFWNQTNFFWIWWWWLCNLESAQPQYVIRISSEAIFNVHARHLGKKNWGVHSTKGWTGKIDSLVCIGLGPTQRTSNRGQTSIFAVGVVGNDWRHKIKLRLVRTKIPLYLLGFLGAGASVTGHFAGLERRGTRRGRAGCESLSGGLRDEDSISNM
jgi:hypothetical protein